MKDILKPALSLLLIALIAAALLGGTYILTKDPIAEQELAALVAARQEVLPDAASFETVSFTPESAEQEIIQEICRGTDPAGETVGYTVSMLAKGYNPDISLTLGIYPDGTIAALNVGSNEESPGLGANASQPGFYGQFAGKQGQLSVTKGIAGENEISAISGATITTKGITNAVNIALGYFEENLAE